MLWGILGKAGVQGKVYRSLKGIYISVLTCVGDMSVYSKFFSCPRGVKQGCSLSPQLFSFWRIKLALGLYRTDRHGVQLMPGAAGFFLSLFADDVILLSHTAAGLQNPLNALKEEADRLKLSANVGKTMIMVFRKGGYLAVHEYAGSTET